MRSRWLICAVISAAATAGAEPEAHVVRGSVTASDGTPIAGAIVTAAGAATAIADDHGAFDLVVTDVVHEATIAASGFTTRTVPLTGGTLDVELAAEGGEVIQVEGRAPARTEPVSYHLGGDEVGLIAGAGNDILRAAQVLPGVARIPYSFGGLALRGTSPADTAVYLDGVEVPIAFHFGGLTSFYPTEMLSDLAVIPGGFDASYGRAEGGIVTLTTREPRTDRWRMGGFVDLLSSGVIAEGPVAGGGLIVGVRRSYLDAVVAPFAPADTPLPSYLDAQVRGSFGDPVTTGRITPMLFFSLDHVADSESGQDPAEPDHVEITSLFVRAAAPYLRQWGPFALRVVPWIGINRLTYEDVSGGMVDTFERPVFPAGLRVEGTRAVPWGELRAGFDGEGGYLSHSRIGADRMVENGQTTMTWLDAAVWAETRIALGHALAIEPGVRVDHYSLTGEWVVDSRLDGDAQVTPTVTLHGALGRFHQPPPPANLDRLGGNPALQSSYYDQVMLGIQLPLPAAVAASLTGYLDIGHGLEVTQDLPMFDVAGLGPTLDLLVDKQLGLPQNESNLGRGESYGIELLAKRHVGRWFALLSYTLAKANVTGYLDPLSNQLSWHPFDLDERHNFNLAGSVALGAWVLGARIQLTSGNPYNRTTCGPLLPDGESFQCESHPYGARLPWFFSLDLRADRMWLTRWGDLHFYVDLQNATNRANVESREFNSSLGGPNSSPDEDITGLPILPYIGVRLVPR